MSLILLYLALKEVVYESMYLLIFTNNMRSKFLSEKL
jgi:hypothetical protein